MLASQPPSQRQRASEPPRSLVDLSDELQLKIIDYLLEQDEEDHARDAKAWDEANVDRLAQDDDFQYHSDLMNWSSTSSYFRNLIAPYIFKQVKLRNDTKSGASIAALRDGPHGALISELHFIGTILDSSGNPERLYPQRFLGILTEAEWNQKVQKEEQDSGDICPMVSDEVLEILSNLSQLSNLEFVSIGFTYPYWDITQELVSCGDLPTNLGPAWRKLISSTYLALTANSSLLFKSLELRCWVFTFTEPFESAKFHDLLGKLEHFALDIRGGANAVAANINTEPAYLAAMATLDQLFLDHLKKAETLTLRAPESGPIGSNDNIGWRGHYHSLLALRTHQMPVLKLLHLEFVFICSDLLAFIASHASTLEVLILRNCASSVIGEYFNVDNFYWKDLFAGMTAARMPRLHHFEVMPRNLPLTDEDDFPRDNWDQYAEEIEEIKHARRILEDKGTNRRLFSYVHVIEYGNWFDATEENLAAFQRGEDQATYDTLLQVLEQNTSTSRKALVIR